MSRACPLREARRRKLFDAQKYKDALAEFRTAYELAPLPELLFNIARCQEYLEDIAGAIRTYDQFLATVAPSLDKKEVTEEGVTFTYGRSYLARDNAIY